MSDPLYDLLAPHLLQSSRNGGDITSEDGEVSTKYLSRLLSLRLSDLTSTEPQSLAQANHSNNVLLQALSSRSYKSTTASATHLSTLHSSLPSLSLNINEVRQAVPALDESAVTFASTYARSRDVPSSTAEVGNATLQARKDSMLLARQSGNLTDILELPALLSTAITSAAAASASGGGGANYSQALDLFAHIKRLSIIYPDSALVRSVQVEAEQAMKSMTTNLLASLRSQNIRLASAIRTVGWLRRVVPELSNQIQFGEGSSVGGSSSTLLKSMTGLASSATFPGTGTAADRGATTVQENSFGALFLVSRLHTFLSMTEALAPLRDLADQETERRISAPTASTAATNTGTTTNASKTANNRRLSTSTSTTTSHSHGTQTERYLKRYIEIFREQSFGTINMYRNIFPPPDSAPPTDENNSHADSDVDMLALPSALQQFPLHLVEILVEVLRAYMPNVTDPAARESLLMQVLYAANSLGRLGADFSMVISLLDHGHDEVGAGDGDDGVGGKDGVEPEPEPEPEWARIVKKHKVQAARLDALSAGQNQNQAARRGGDVAVR